MRMQLTPYTQKNVTRQAYVHTTTGLQIIVKRIETFRINLDTLGKVLNKTLLKIEYETEAEQPVIMIECSDNNEMPNSLGVQTTISTINLFKV